MSFWYAPDYFVRLAADAGARRSERRFKVASLPALRPLSPLVAYAGLGIRRAAGMPWEEFAVTLAARTVRLASGVSIRNDAPPLNAEARVARAVRMIDRHPEAALTLAQFARVSGLSPYHLLRTFKSLIGVTPHQYLLRARLREAAARLAIEPSKVLDVALDCGFGDVSNFNQCSALNSARAHWRSGAGRGEHVTTEDAENTETYGQRRDRRERRVESLCDLCACSACSVLIRCLPALRSSVVERFQASRY